VNELGRWGVPPAGQDIVVKGVRTKGPFTLIAGPRDWVVPVSIGVIVVGVVGIVVALIIAVLALKDRGPVAKVVAEVPAYEANFAEIPLNGIELPLDPQPLDVEWRPQAADIRILGVTLLPDGRLEVRGEVPQEQRTDLSTFHVEVTFEGESQVGFIDANTRTWKVFFEQSHSLVPGKKLDFKAVLVGANQNAFSVQPAGPIS
jgi:hypothetical protein